MVKKLAIALTAMGVMAFAAPSTSEAAWCGGYSSGYRICPTRTCSWNNCYRPCGTYYTSSCYRRCVAPTFYTSNSWCSSCTTGCNYCW